MASHHPLLLHQTLKANHATIMRVKHELHQGGHHTVKVSVFFFCTGVERQNQHLNKLFTGKIHSRIVWLWYDKDTTMTFFVFGDVQDVWKPKKQKQKKQWNLIFMWLAWNRETLTKQILRTTSNKSFTLKNDRGILSLKVEHNLSWVFQESSVNKQKETVNQHWKTYSTIFTHYKFSTQKGLQFTIKLPAMMKK